MQPFWKKKTAEVPINKTVVIKENKETGKAQIVADVNSPEKAKDLAKQFARNERTGAFNRNVETGDTSTTENNYVVVPKSVLKDAFNALDPDL